MNSGKLLFFKKFLTRDRENSQTITLTRVLSNAIKMQAVSSSGRVKLI